MTTCTKDNVSCLRIKNESIQKSYRELAEKRFVVVIVSQLQSTKLSILPCKMQSQTGYLVDDNTGQPEVGNVLMDNQTGAILDLSAVVITKATKTKPRL